MPTEPKTEALLPCPHCNCQKSISPESNGEYMEDDEYARWVEGGNEQWTYVCDVHDGGCGSSCGFHKTKELAIAAWNRRTPTPAVGDGEDKAILDFVERNFRIFHISGPDMSGKDWVVRIPPTETAPAKRERHLTLRDAAISAIHATGGPGK